MTRNFSDSDFKKVSVIFNGNLFNARVNKSGNIQLVVKDLSKFNHTVGNKNKRVDWKKRLFTFYNTSDGILIRELNYGRSYHDSSIFPLNMNAISRNTDNYYGYPHYNIKYSTFENIDDAIVYFIEYLNIYHNIVAF